MMRKALLALLGTLSFLLASACSSPELGGAPSESSAPAAGHAQELPATSCSSCHRPQYDEWRSGMHAYSGEDPAVEHALARAISHLGSSSVSDSCNSCHKPEAVLSSDASEALRTPDAHDGIGCKTCHANVVSPAGGQGVSFTPIATANARATCVGCHSITPENGLPQSRTAEEWAASSYAAQGVDCATCHMPVTEDGRHDHTFGAATVPLVPGYERAGAHAADFMRSRASVSASIVGEAMHVAVTNRAGHSLPSGNKNYRDAWLQLTIRDEADRVVFESGTLDERGDLRIGKDEHLAAWGQYVIRDGSGSPLATPFECKSLGHGVLTDASQELVTFTWEAERYCDRVIASGATETVTYPLSGLGAGRYTAEVALLYRTLPPRVLRELGITPTPEAVVPFVMAEETLTFSLYGSP